MYTRILAPSRGMTMQEPLAEWIADLFRVSGKSVFSEGTISTTPQRKSFGYIRNVSGRNLRCDCISRTGLLAIHGDAKRLANPRMRAIRPNNKLGVYNFWVFVGFPVQAP